MSLMFNRIKFIFPFSYSKSNLCYRSKNPILNQQKTFKPEYFLSSLNTNKLKVLRSFIS